MTEEEYDAILKQQAMLAQSQPVDYASEKYNSSLQPAMEAARIASEAAEKITQIHPSPYGPKIPTAEEQITTLREATENNILTTLHTLHSHVANFNLTPEFRTKLLREVLDLADSISKETK